jgi:hypothetical protein
MRLIALLILHAFLFTSAAYPAEPTDNTTLRVPMAYGKDQKKHAENRSSAAINGIDPNSAKLNMADKEETGMPGTEERRKFYMKLAKDVNSYLEDTGMLCKWHSAVIVEKLFKEYGIRAAIMEKNISEEIKHYWVKTEDNFIIDAFTIGYDFYLRRKAKELTNNVYILVMNKNTKDKTELQIIEEFYSDAIFYHELTLEIYAGKSVIEEASVMKRFSTEEGLGVLESFIKNQSSL